MNNKLLPLLGIFTVGMVSIYYITSSQFNLQSLGLLIFVIIFVPTLIKPLIGFSIIIVAMLFSPDVFMGTTSRREVTIRVEDAFLIVVLIASLLRSSFRKDIAKTFRSQLTRPYIFYVLAGILSSVLAALISHIDLKYSLFSSFKFLEYFLLFLVVRINLKTLTQVKYFTILFLLVAMVVSLHSHLFIEEQLSSGKEYFRTAPPVATRAPGESGTLGGYLVFMMAIAIGLMLYIRSHVIRVLLIFLLMLMFRSFLYTLSRGSYLAFFSMIIAMAALSKKITFTYLAAIFLVLLVIFAPGMIKKRVATTIIAKETVAGAYYELEGSPKERIMSWEKTLNYFLPASPIFGHGVGKYFIDGQIFTTLIESGLLGFSLLIWLWIRIFKMAKAILDQQRSIGHNFGVGVSVGFLAGFLGLVFQALSTNTFIIIRIMEPFWFFAAMLAVLPELTVPSLDEVSAEPSSESPFERP